MPDEGAHRRRTWQRILGPSMASGPRVGWLFHRALAAIFLCAWLSLGVQVHALVGSRGLLPVRELLAAADQQGLGVGELPTVFWWSASDGALSMGIVAGVVLAALALAGVATRACFAASTALYLSYAVACRTFLSFQWDSLLLECGALAALLPVRAPAPWIHALLRLLCFKLYFESGIAKWQSPIGDWHDGSAMAFYYETAPLPTWLAWYAHGLPDAWHRLESWATLVFELAVPLAFLGPRRARLGAALALTAFQIVNLATANYGFFVHLAVALHLFLLDDADLMRARSWLSARLPRLSRMQRRVAVAVGRGRRVLRRVVQRRRWPRAPAAVRRAAVLAAVAGYVVVSAAEAAEHFGGAPFGAGDLGPLELAVRLRLVNNYHLFGQITRDRIEPEVQTTDAAFERGTVLDEEQWTSQPLHHKPGDPQRAPGLVAPHQPRLDFQLWFYGLSHARGVPSYAARLLDRVCHDPDGVAGFFPRSLPREPTAVRFAFHRYRFTTREERRASGAWWVRESMGATRPLWCAR